MVRVQLLVPDFIENHEKEFYEKFFELSPIIFKQKVMCYKISGIKKEPSLEDVIKHASYSLILTKDKTSNMIRVRLAPELDSRI